MAVPDPAETEAESLDKVRNEEIDKELTGLGAEKTNTRGRWSVECRNALVSDSKEGNEATERKSRNEGKLRRISARYSIGQGSVRTVEDTETARAPARLRKKEKGFSPNRNSESVERLTYSKPDMAVENVTEGS